jgi:hypothetical protein
MDKNLFKCGECGQELHRLYFHPSGNIIVECVGCRSQSELKADTLLSIKNYKGPGTLTLFD